MADLTEKELIERFMEGLKVSADSMRMLGIARGYSDFLGISRILDEIRINAHRLAVSKVLSPQVLREGLNRYSEAIGNG